MSGGAFNYIQRNVDLDDAEDRIEDIIRNNGVEYDDITGERVIFYSPETIERFKEGLQKIKEARIYLQRIDWFLSGDDGEDNFHERLNKELKQLNNNQNG